MGKSDMFTLYLNYGGSFTNIDGVVDYVGGQLLNKWGFDRDKFGYFDLVEEFQQLGYLTWTCFWYRIPKTQDFRPIKDDSGVMEMLELVEGRCRIINVYIEDGKLFDEVVDEATITMYAGKGKGDENSGEGEKKQVEEDKDDSGKKKQKEVEENKYDNGKGKQKEVHEENYDSDLDSDFDPSDDASEVSLHDLDFISDDEFALAKRNLKDYKLGSVFELLDEFDEFDQLDLDKPHISDYEDLDEPHISDYEDSDGPYQSSETDEDDPTVRRRKHVLIYDPKCDHKDMQVLLGMHFQDGLQCKEALQNWAIENSRYIRFRKVSKVKCEAWCNPPCPWRVFGSVVPATGKFMIKRYYGDHECPKSMSNKLLSSNWIAKRYLNVFRLRYNLQVVDLRDDILHRFKCYVPKDRLYRAKHLAQETVRGTVEAHYGSLRRYLAELKRVDKDGRFELLLGDEHVFKGLYIGFSALKKGFLQSCRPFLGLDGCHLKTYMGGILLCVVGNDGNNQMFPIAWAVVEVENEECWTWFLKLIMHELGISNGNGWIFMSDQQKGLQNVVSKLAPYVEHRNCARHIYGNFKKRFLAAYMYALDELRTENTAAFQDFISRDTSKFCKAFISSHLFCDVIENNITECFNGWITRARGKHVIQMLEDIRKTLMDRQVTKVKELKKVNDRICPRIRLKLEESKRNSIHCNSVPALYNKFEVHVGADSFSVDKNQHTCTCREWQLSGIPCIHAISAINYVEEDPALFVHEYFTVKKCLEAYQFGLEPINGEKMWPEVEGFTVKPPWIRAQPGRPKKKRIRGPEEKVPGKLSKHGSVMTCSKCHQKGHNMKGCKNDPVEKPFVEKRKRGRPAKSKEAVNDQADKGKRKQKAQKGKWNEAAQKKMKNSANGIFIINENSGNTTLHQTASHGGMAHFSRFITPRTTSVSSSYAQDVDVTATQGSSSSSQVIQQPSDSPTEAKLLV